RRPRFRALGPKRARRDATRGWWSWYRRRTALSRRAYRRALAAHRSPQLGATLGQLPDPSHGLRRLATRVPATRCRRAGVVRIAAGFELSHDPGPLPKSGQEMAGF